MAAVEGFAWAILHGQLLLTMRISAFNTCKAEGLTGCTHEGWACPCLAMLAGKVTMLAGKVGFAGNARAEALMSGYLFWLCAWYPLIPTH